MVLAVSEKTFHQDVLGSSVPVIVSFWAPWCGVCKIVTPFLKKLQSEWDVPMRVVSINADENFKLANMYRLTTLPTVMVFSDGNLVKRLDNFRNRDDLNKAEEELRSALGVSQFTYSRIA